MIVGFWILSWIMTHLFLNRFVPPLLQLITKGQGSLEKEEELKTAGPKIRKAGCSLEHLLSLTDAPRLR